MKTYKGYTLQTVNGSTYIYKDNDLKGCTHSDGQLNNSEAKAIVRIDRGTVNMLQAMKEGTWQGELMGRKYSI